MPSKLYYMAASPPARAVLVALKTLKVDYELHEIDLVKGEHRREDFIDMNPQHTVPVLVEDDGFVICDSHAINAYLVSKYAENDELYPKDLKKRATVDHRLHFDTGVTFQAIKNLATSFFFEKTINGITDQVIKKFEDTYEILEKYLKQSKYLAGNAVTIADWSALTTIANMELFVPVNMEKFPKLGAYIDRGNYTVPFLAELNKIGIAHLKVIFKDFNFEKPTAE